MDKRYRLYVEMQQRGKGTGVYRLVGGCRTLTHHQAVTVRSKYPWASHTHLVEVDSPFERSLVLYEGWHDDLDARIAELRERSAPPTNTTPTA
jgi:hypothetical protein